MSKLKIISSLALIWILVSCSNDLQETTSHFDLQSVEYLYSTQTHEHFFNDDYIINKNESLIPAVKSRSLDPKIEAVKYLVYYQDGQKNFIPDLVNQVGYPLWSEAEAYEYFVYVPFIKQTSSLIEGYLIVKIVDNNYDFYLMKRNKLYAGIFGYSGYDNFNGEISAFLHFDDKLFSASDDLISGFSGLVDDNEIIIDSRCTILNWCNCVAWHAVFRPEIEVETRGGCSANCSECVCTYYIHPDCWDDADQNEWGGGFGSTDWDAESNDDPPGGTGPGGYDNGGSQNPPDWWAGGPLDEAGLDEIELLNYINMVCDHAETSDSGLSCQELLNIIDPDCMNAPDFEVCVEVSINNASNDESDEDCSALLEILIVDYGISLTKQQKMALIGSNVAPPPPCGDPIAFEEYFLNELMEDYFPNSPELVTNLDYSTKSWLVENSAIRDAVAAFLDSHLESESNTNLSQSIAIAYVNILKDENLTALELELGEVGNFADPLWDIMKEQLWEMIKELVVDFIPGATLATLGPELFSNLQNGNWMDGMYIAMDILLNEADILFPAAKVTSFAIGVAVTGKQLKKMFEAFKKAKSLGAAYLEKLYNIFKSRIGWDIPEIREKFRSIEGIGAKIDDYIGGDFWDDILEEFEDAELTSIIDSQSGLPFFKILDLPANNSIYMISYPVSSQGYFTIKFYIGASNATTDDQLSPKYALRFDF